MKKYILFLFVSLFINFNVVVAQITTQPHDTIICEGNNASFSISVDYPNSEFKWQVDTNSIGDFINIVNSTHYADYDTDTLNLINIPVSFNLYKYRCLVDTSGTRVDTSNIVNLTVNPTYYYTENQEICDSDSLLWQGTYYKIAGQYFANYQTANTCDSIYELNLTVDSTYYYIVNDTICNGDSLLWQGIYYKIAGQYFGNYQTVNTCDSIYELNLIVNPLPTTTISGENVVCGNQYDVVYSTSDYIPGNIYDWNIEPPDYGKITYQYQNKILINWGTVSGTVTVSLIEKNNYGCEAQASFSVTISESLAPDKAEIELKGNNILICSDTLVDNYQWGYYDNSLNIENILTGEINQFYQAIPFDTINYNYWVITGFNNGCETKSYYNPPTLPSVINEEKIYQEIVIYPNPNKGIFIIEIENNMFCDVILIIRDNLGREIKKQVFIKNTNFINKKINIQNVVSGFYFVEIIFNNRQRYVKKIIVK